MSCNCPYYPTVIVPGIGHSRVNAVDDTGKIGKYVFPPDISTKDIISSAAAPFVKLIATRNTEKYIPQIKDALSQILAPLSVSKEGTPVFPQKVESYRYPFSEYSESVRRHIYACVPLQELGEVIGEDHMFFFAFNSFGQPFEAAAQLNEYIQFVKRTTGHDKVNLVAISLGGCVSVAYLDAYGYKGDVHRLINFVPAINGTSFVADIIDNRVKFDDPKELFGLFMGGHDAEMITSYLKKIPAKIYDAFMQAVVDVIREKILINCPNIWGTVPKERYEYLRNRYLSDGSYNVLRAKTDRFHRAQMNYERNVEIAQKAGTQFFGVCGYDRQLIPVCMSNAVSSDGVIDTRYASGFSKLAPLGSQFPESYTQLNTRCNIKGHNHISPDRTVDASCALFPDTTWFFKNQFHDAIAYNDVALTVTKKILTDESFTDVFCDPAFPQFNGTRNTRVLVRNLLPRCKNIDTSSLTFLQRAELEAALSDAQKLLSQTILTDGTDVEPVTQRLKEILEEINA
ncbi:MAG: hypothetical protein MJ177_07090 [Clostridia bacterium]|nr:hypothetical protein [Clostridia bacterium]